MHFFDALMPWQPFWLFFEMAMEAPEPKVVPPRRDKAIPHVVLPRDWSAERLKPWAAKMVPKPPKAPVPKHLLQGRLLKCLANVYNLGKMDSEPAMIAHAREAMSLKVELQTYLKAQQKHGPVAFPTTEAWSRIRFRHSFCCPCDLNSLRSTTRIFWVACRSGYCQVVPLLVWVFFESPLA